MAMIVVLSCLLAVSVTMVQAQCNSLGAQCWSTTAGVASGGCCAGTQCGPWLPDGGAWNGADPWYCLAMPTLADGATCDYVRQQPLSLIHSSPPTLLCILDQQTRTVQWRQLLQWSLFFNCLFF